MSERNLERCVRGDDAVDFQMHTVYSDGHWQPAELFDYLAAHGFRAVAVTDHDTLEHADELVALGDERGIIVLRACEVSTNWRGGRSRPALLCGRADEWRARSLRLGHRAHSVREHPRRI